MKKRILSIIMAICMVIAVLPLSACDKQATNSYEISVNLDTEAKSFTATQITTFTNNSETDLDNICFNLYQNSTREDAKYTAVPKQMKFSAYPNGNSYGGITFESVQIADKETSYEVCGADKNMLKINLATSLKSGETTQITMKYAVKLANINSRLGYGNSTVNLGNFYPILAVLEEETIENPQSDQAPIKTAKFYECIPHPLGDPFYSETANYKVDITLPTEYLVASSGKEIAKEQSDTTKTIHYEADNIRSFAMVCSDKFQLQTQIKNGKEINYYYLTDKTPTQTTALIASALNSYTQNYGDYEYETLAVVDADFFQGGMEYSALTMISTAVQPDFRKVVIAHETAHQWFETMVGTNENQTAVLDEGLAEYATYQFFDIHPDYNINTQAVIAQKQKEYATYEEILNVLGEPIPPNPVQSLAEYRSSYDYYILAYVKSHLIFHDFALKVGEPQFLSFLKQFKTQYNMQNATLEDLITMAEKEFGEEQARTLKSDFYPR